VGSGKTPCVTSTARRRRRGHWQNFKDLVSLWLDLFDEHGLLTFATAIAFRALVAFVALVLLVAGILGQIGHEDVWTKHVGPQIKPKVLPQVYDGIDATFEKVFHTSSYGLIALAALLTIWEIAVGVRTCMEAFSRIYDTEDDRPTWVRVVISLGISTAMTAALVGSILLATAARSAVHSGWSIPFTIFRWLLAIVVMIGAFGILVRFAPAERRTTRWVTGGATAVVVAWVVQTLIFWLYLRHLANYRSAAGSLLGVYFLTTYLYVAAIVLLVGIQLDELLRRDVQGKDDRGILELVRGVL
jgi:membrane protein